MAIDRLPPEIMAAIAEHVVLPQPIRESYEIAANVNLALVNRYFYSIIINTPSLWGSVSNKQSPQALRLCLQRSKQSALRVVLLLIEDYGTDSYVEFLTVVVPHASRWKEFYFETGHSLSDYLLIIHNLSYFCHDLYLPQLHRLTLLYPDPLFYDSDWNDYMYEGEIIGYVSRSWQPKNHFYNSWITPNLRHLRTKNLIPYHTEGAKLVTCEIETQASCYPEWRVEPLLTMYPHWVGLKSLSLRFGEEFVYTHEPPRMGTIVLPLLENITLSFRSDAGMSYRPCILDILDFPNVVNIDARFAALDYSGIQHAVAHIRALLRPQTDHAKLEQMKVTLGYYGAIVFTAIFRKNFDTLDIRHRSAAIKDNDDEPQTLSPDPQGIQSIACTKEIVDILRRQSGWQELSELTIVKGNEDKAERVRSVFPHWTIYH